MTTTPSLEDLIAASVPPDIEEATPALEISEENDQVTSGAASLNSSTVFLPVKSSFFGPSSRTEAENIQHEHDEKLRLQWEAEKAAMPKTPPKVVKANNPDELLKKAKEYMATPKELKHTNVMRTPDRRPDSYGSSSGSRGLPRSPHTNNLFDHYRGRKNWGKPILFGSATTIGDHIRYEPSDPAKDQGFRTIMIPVDPTTTLEKLIESKLVGKGQILSAQMLDVRTIKGVDSKKMARIIFVNEPKWTNDEDAMRGVSWCAAAPAYKVTTKTWPMTEKWIADIARGYTRVLSLYGIENINRFSVPEVLDKKNIQPATSPCHYKCDIHIISSASDECDKITIEFNSIESACGFLYWIQKEMRALGKTPLKFRFEKDNTMTADVFAAHIEFGSNDDVTENAPDRQHTPSARHPIRPIRKNTLTKFNICIPDMNGANAVVSGDVDLPVVDDAIMHTSRVPSTIQDIAASEALRPNTLLDILKDVVPGFARPIAYQPPMNRNTSPAKVLPGEKKFSFAAFPTTQGMYPDGPDEAERRGHYKRKPTKADSYRTTEDIAELEALRKEAEKKKDEKSPGFVYSDEERGRPQTPGPLKAPKMGLYKSKTGLNWDEDDDDNFGLADLDFKPISVNAQASEDMAANAQPVATQKAEINQSAPVASVFPHTNKAVANKVARPPSPHVGDDLTADKAFIGSGCTLNNSSSSSTMPAITDSIAVLTEHFTGGDQNVAFIASTSVMPTFSVSSGMSSNYQPASVEEEVAQEVPRVMVTSAFSNIQHPSTVSLSRSEMLSVPPNIPPGRQNRSAEEMLKDRNSQSAAFAARNAPQPAPGANQNRSANETMSRLDRRAASFASRAFQPASSGERIAPAPLRPVEELVRVYRQPAAFAAQNAPQPATNAECFTQGQGRNLSTTADRGCRDGCCEDAIRSSHPSGNTNIPAAPGSQAPCAPASSFQSHGHIQAHPSVSYATPVAPPHPSAPDFGMPSHGNGAAGRGRPVYDGNTFSPDYVQDPITKFWMDRRTGDVLAFFPGAGHGAGFSQTSLPHYSVAQTRYGYPLVRND